MAIKRIRRTCSCMIKRNKDTGRYESVYNRAGQKFRIDKKYQKYDWIYKETGLKPDDLVRVNIIVQIGQHNQPVRKGFEGKLEDYIKMMERKNNRWKKK